MEKKSGVIPGETELGVTGRDTAAIEIPEAVQVTPPPLVPIDQDSTKRELEHEKLRLKIAKLKRQWLPPEYAASAVALLIGLGTIGIAWTNGLFDVNTKLLEIRRHDLAADVDKFQKQKESLEREGQELRRLTKELVSNNKELIGENQRLVFINREEVKRGKGLEQDLKLTELKASITALSHATGGLSLNDPTLKRIYALIEGAGSKSLEVQYAAAVVNSRSVGVPLSAALCVPLGRVTNDVRWMQTLMQFAVKEMSDSIRATLQRDQSGTSFFVGSNIDWSRGLIYLDLLSKNASTDEKVAVLKILYQVVESTRTPTRPKDSRFANPFSDETIIVKALANWEAEATSRFPSFWLDHVGSLIRTSISGPFGSLVVVPRVWRETEFDDEGLAKLSLQAFIIDKLIRFVNQTPNHDVEILLNNCQFPTGFPLKCESKPALPNDESQLTQIKKGFFKAGGKATVLHLNMREIYRTWIADNPKLSKLWTDSDLKALRSAPPSVIGRAIQNKWLAESEVSESQ
jgi:hypothetical protein